MANLNAVTDPADPGPISIAPPPVLRIAAWIGAAQAVGVLVVAVVVITGRRDADLKWALATAAYFVVLALLMAAVSRGLLKGRRWARTPAIVLELIFALVGYYLAFPSGQLLPGLGVLLVGAGTLALLISKPSNDWISGFPSLFGPGPDR